MRTNKIAIMTVGGLIALFLMIHSPVYADYGFAASEKSGYGFSQNEKQDYGFVKCAEPAAEVNVAGPSHSSSGTVLPPNVPLYQYPNYPYSCYGYRAPDTYCHCPQHNNLPYRYYGYCQNNHFINAYNPNHHRNNGYAVSQQPATVIGVTYLLPNK